ncbi:MAG: hypothetical protein AAFP17_11445 [Pseudomonadota bacterium]
MFVAGGMPTHTYVNRDELGLEKLLYREVDEGYKIVCITGPTKSGKTVLCNKVFGQEKCLWIPGGQIEGIDEFWSYVIGELELPDEEKTTRKSSIGANIGALIGLKSQIEMGKEFRITKNLRSIAMQFIRESNLKIIVDDFHYINSDTQRAIIDALKSEIFHGLCLILIATPHHAFDAIARRREMEGRFSHIRIPTWSVDQLERIGKVGFPLLNMEVTEDCISNLAEESFESPLLMQRFCSRLCSHFEIGAKLGRKRSISPTAVALEQIFEEVAESSGFPAFQKLSTGPQSRSKRLERRLANSNEKADIYECILFAIAKTGPKSTITYNEIRSVLQDILEPEHVPQKQQVSHALSQMSTIAKEKIDGEPVVEWIDDVLHITDPHLMFYLRWVIRRQRFDQGFKIFDFLSTLLKGRDLEVFKTGVVRPRDNGGGGFGR